MSDHLGPQPEPKIEPGEPNPGGVDAVPENGNHTVPDLSPEENPSIEEKAPEPLKDAMKEDDDTSTQATRDEDHEPEKESPA
jgi:hypothetical protein